MPTWLLENKADLWCPHFFVFFCLESRVDTTTQLVPLRRLAHSRGAWSTRKLLQLSLCHT